MTSVRILGGAPLLGVVTTPGDKSISHRALLLAALADGTSEITGLSDGEDVGHTRQAIEQLGASVHEHAPGMLSVEGGRARLRPPAEPIDCGNSGTGMRLLAGVVAGLDGATVLTGDESLSSRPMDRIAEPLSRMGAKVEGRGERCLPPITVHGGHLSGIEWSPPMTSAQVKSCILLAGLSAAGPTVVTETVATRAHTEEMLAEAGADISVEQVGDQGRRVTLRPGALEPRRFRVPGDPSQAAFWVVAGCLVPGSEVRVAGVYGGPERTGFLSVLRRMGASVSVEADGDGGAVDIVASASTLTGTVVDEAEIPSLDEVPVLAVAAAAAHGTTIFRDVGELRVKEVDRLAATAALVTAIGGRAEVVGDELRVHGTGGRLCHARTDSQGDHRMAMSACVAALAAGPGESEVDGFEAVATSYPAFLDDLRLLAGPGAAEADAGDTVVRGKVGRIVAIDGPAGSGKSTVSRLVAARLGMPRLDTGAMYRSVAWATLERGLALDDHDAVAALAEQAHIEADDQQTRIDGVDVTDAIRTPPVNQAVSAVAANPRVRRAMVIRQRRWAEEHGGGVVEGRDIGSAVFPHAELKVYLDATPDERARRRAEETPDGVARRDRIDSTRAASPLAVAPGARVLDTTGKSVEDVVEEVLSWL